MDEFRLSGVLALLSLILFLELRATTEAGGSDSSEDAHSLPRSRRFPIRALRGALGLVFVASVTSLCAMAIGGGRLVGADLIFVVLLLIVAAPVAASTCLDTVWAWVLRQWREVS